MATDTGIAAYESLGADINKLHGALEKETKQGIGESKLPELTLEMPDDDLIKLTQKWKKIWDDSPKKREWEEQIKNNEKYWLGKHHSNPRDEKIGQQRPIMDNVIFEALETYLPQATRRNPEPVVSLAISEKEIDGSEKPEKTKYAQKVKTRLGDWADSNKLRLKLKRAARYWAIQQIATAKFGWSEDKMEPIVRMIRAPRIILDPEATIDEDGYTGDRIGEYRKLTASRMLAIIGKGLPQASAAPEQSPDNKGIFQKERDSVSPKSESFDPQKFIREKVDGDLDTELTFIEWWTPQYMCWTLDKNVLYKNKNPHWNYDKKPEDQQNIDAYGNATPATEPVKGINHLPSPSMPYRFLSVFNLGDQPMDKTSLIHQNLANQDIINKRNKQIDKNVDDTNNGIVVSLARSGLTKDQANGLTRALRKGGTVVIPDGSPREAIDRYPAPSLSPDVYNDLRDKRNRLMDIFGTRGSTTAGLLTEKTMRGKNVLQAKDTDRIGGGVSEYLEQFADDIYNMVVQLFYVYDSDFQFVGGGRPPRILVSVKEGSLLPKDSTTLANQAIQLGTEGKMALVDMYKALERPNPEELAANVWLEANAPQLLFKNNPLVQEALQTMAAASGGASKPPSESISFKDLPPEGKAQMAEKGGIHLDPASIAAHELENKKPPAVRSSPPIPNMPAG